ncbi:MAG: electron transfer flavoprotein subunit alpha/FixB family protein, partial [Planctomycetota bacterium]
LAEDARLAERTAEHWARTLADLVESEHPETILAPATALWRAALPRAAALLHTGLTADCTGLDVSKRNGHLLQTRPAFGGDVMATITCPGHRPEMATVRPGVMSPPERDGSAKPSVRQIQPSDEAFEMGTRLLEVQQDEEEAVNIADADIIVAGGRGLGGPEGFELLREAAEELGGEVASSRPPVDAGWMPYPRQVGQTGTTVQPKLYLACGISGSVQHRVGMQSSDLIVAVNTDPDAPIFEIADYGIVGDYRQVLPALVEELKERRRAHVSHR